MIKKLTIETDRENGWKICDKCSNKKDLKEFLLIKNKRFHNYCNQCRSEYHREYRETNWERLNNLGREWYLENRETIREFTKSSEYKAQKRIWSKNYRDNNKEIIAAQDSVYRNKPESKKRRNEKARNRRKNDIDYHIICNLRTRLAKLFSEDRINKSKNTISFLGCDFESLKEHIESQFSLGMTWNNYGINGWHIDHILPCELFDLKDERQQNLCFNYTNLRPMWNKENSGKRDRLPSGRFACELSQNEKLEYLRELGFSL